MRNYFFTLVIGLAGFIVQKYFISSEIEVSQDLLTNIITFLSILFGFYITSLAIFITSKYVADFYKLIDKNNPTQTLLHTLLKEYEYGLCVVLISLVYFISLSLLYIDYSNNSYGLVPKNFLIIPLISINIFYSYLMLKNLIKIVIQEAKKI